MAARGRVNIHALDRAELDRLYEASKKDWIARHPEATPEEYERAMREISERIGY